MRVLTMSDLNEGLRHNELRNLIEPLISIDQYKSKSGDDKNVCVVAIKINKENPAKAFSQFLETGIQDAIDVDTSPGPDHNGLYTVFIELERKSTLFEQIEKIIKCILTSDEEVCKISFTSYENKQPQVWDKDLFHTSVLTRSYDYEIKHNPDAKEINDRVKFLNKY